MCIFAISKQGSMEDLTDEGELHIFSVNQSNSLVQLYSTCHSSLSYYSKGDEMAYWLSAKLVKSARIQLQ